MDEICLHCGDKGFENAFVYCVKCLKKVVHRYCLHVIPKTLDEYVHWVCDECGEKLEKESLILKDNAIPCQTRYSQGFRVEKNNVNDVVVRTEDKIYEGDNYCLRPLHESDLEPHTTESCVVSCNDCQRSSKKRKTVGSSEANIEDQKKRSVSTGPSSGDEAIDEEIWCLDTSTEGSGLVSRTDHNENNELVVSEISAKPLQTMDFLKYSMNESNTSSMYESLPCPEPVIRPIWRGSFDMQKKKKNEILSGLSAHVSNKACHKVYEEACQFQPVLHLEMLPKSDVWPKSFEISKPTSDNIALYFFPSEISARDFDLLLNKMVREKLAMRSFVQNAELLVFPSDLLPLQNCKIQDKYYLWGVFRGKPAPSPSQICTEEYGQMVEVDVMNLDPQPPCISDAEPCTAESRVVLFKESERSLKRMKSVGSDEAMFKKQIQETGSTRPQKESEANLYSLRKRGGGN